MILKSLILQQGLEKEQLAIELMTEKKTCIFFFLVLINILFQVRKEKLGDRITALHQIVSPFGKVPPRPYILHPFRFT